MADLLVILPTRGRPHNIADVLAAWDETGGFEHADLLLAVDADDPANDDYLRAVAGHPRVLLWTSPWQKPMVTLLNEVAVAYADSYRLLAFAGDDNLPRTAGWAKSYIEALTELGTGIVYPDDLVQREKLPTQWAMTSDIVRALGAMVPSKVTHLYADNTLLALGREAGCIRYLPDVVVEHRHPVAGTAEMDDGYRRVNSPDRYRDDRRKFVMWVEGRMADDVAKVRALREAACQT